MLAIAEKMPETSESIPLIGKHFALFTCKQAIVYICLHRDLPNGCDGDNMRVGNNDGHRAELLLQRTYPHPGSYMGATVNECKQKIGLHVNVLFTYLQDDPGEKAPDHAGSQ